MAELDRNPRYSPVAQEEEINGALTDIYAEYPALSRLGVEVVDSRDVGMTHPRNRGGGHLEFYPADERDNPRRGVPTIELFDPKGTGNKLRNWLFGDMLHQVWRVHPRFNALREAYRRSITDEQRKHDRAAYARHGDPRSFEQWFEVSRLDAHIRGYLAEQWPRDIYSGEQVQLLEMMRGELKRSHHVVRYE